MVQKELRHPRRTNQEWLDLIQECRASGMSDNWIELRGNVRMVCAVYFEPLVQRPLDCSK